MSVGKVSRIRKFSLSIAGNMPLEKSTKIAANILNNGSTKSFGRKTQPINHKNNIVIKNLVR
ncbi:hypothetical protein A2W14_04985 [Candidatus Gottesmanbacteria bacterium RBG_16_37_8]|uniref:Uncharacterized protein n=1 Tax=Candidatus Gottesmanbacteria bacterium RBG_16_37_8 TaxID=1798371 RepID=A0A1F5YUU2_9BACT|nr:MAG: hypothetical protein A2W14_04985 [Candidatus Gottesmanbacteria bacterium RBG_16_37_8]